MKNWVFKIPTLIIRKLVRSSIRIYLPNVIFMNNFSREFSRISAFSCTKIYIHNILLDNHIFVEDACKKNQLLKIVTFNFRNCYISDTFAVKKRHVVPMDFIWTSYHWIFWPYVIFWLYVDGLTILFWPQQKLLRSKIVI